MNFSVVDSGRLLAAVLVTAVTLVAPGVALSRAFGGILRYGEARRDTVDACVLALALLPALASVATRGLGLDAALALDFVLAACGLRLLLRGRRDATREAVAIWGPALVGCWLAIVLVEWVDFDTGAKLFQPLTAYDSVKHAATTQAIVESGAPPRDAFFLRPERSSYYYYFYTLSAFAVRLSGGLVDARAAVGALVFWTGLGAYGLVRFALRRCGIVLAAARAPLPILAVLALGGLDLVMVARKAMIGGEWPADPLRWNEQVGAWFEDILWVPHHVSALIAGTVGLAALCTAIGERDTPVPKLRAAWKAVALAGLCFASMLGLSVWVTLGFVATVGVWSTILGPVERRWGALLPLVVAGSVAFVLSAAQLHDLAAGRGGPFPIALTIRVFGPFEERVRSWPLLLAARALALPLNYFIGFGALTLGTLAYWRARRLGALPSAGEFGRVLAVAAVCGLVVGTFFRSTLFNNDLGWRVMLLPLLAGTVWTIAVVERWRSDPRGAATSGFVTPAFRVACVLGWINVLYAGVMMRAYPFVHVDEENRFMGEDPRGQRALRVAFEWARDHLPQQRVLQQNPTLKRTLAFGLYGRHAIGVSDSFGSLYGASAEAVDRRLAAIGPVFTARLGDGEVARRVAANGIDDLVVTSSDPVWADKASFIWRHPPVFETKDVRVLSAETLEAAR